jgi:hypothetical protein
MKLLMLNLTESSRISTMEIELAERNGAAIEKLTSVKY